MEEVGDGLDLGVSHTLWRNGLSAIRASACARMRSNSRRREMARLWASWVSLVLSDRWRNMLKFAVTLHLGHRLLKAHRHLLAEDVDTMVVS
jgi:hypothetical protein